MIFSQGGVQIYGLYIDPFWNFLRKSRTLFGIFVPIGSLQNTILRAVQWGKNGFHFPKIVYKVKVINEFGLLLVCHL